MDNEREAQEEKNERGGKKNEEAQCNGADQKNHPRSRTNARLLEENAVLEIEPRGKGENHRKVGEGSAHPHSPAAKAHPGRGSSRAEKRNGGRRRRGRR